MDFLPVSVCFYELQNCSLIVLIFCWVSLQDSLEDEQKEITSSIGKLERQAAHITEQMRIEAQVAI